MNTALLYLALLAPPQDSHPDRIAPLLAQIRQSGIILSIGDRQERLTDTRRQIAPGAPPLLSFRYFQGADRHRFSKLDLMLDDAGH